MDERKGVTVSYLRELARKYLRERSGTSRGRQLVSSLAERIPVLGRLVRMAGLASSQRSSGDVGGEERTLESSARTPQASPEAVPLPRPEAAGSQARELSEEPITEPSRGPRTKPAKVVTFLARAKGRRRPDDEDTVPSPPEAPTPRPSGAPKGDVQEMVARAAEPLVEGFFVTRVAGETEARKHHLLEEQTARLPPADATPERDEHLGPLPLGYQDDAMVLLARDPHTLFLFWDFSEASRNRALDDLASPRAVLKVFDGDGVSREVDFALESRGYYLQGLEPGRTYRAEAHFVGADGRSRRIGHSSNRATLPPYGPSLDTSIRFLRMPPPPVVDRSRRDEVVAAVPSRVPEVEEREYVTWRRVRLPGSAGEMDVPEVHRERTEKYVDAPRAPGASDQRYEEAERLAVPPRVSGASEQRYEEAEHLEAPPRVPGASDQRYEEAGHLEAPPRVPGASDQRHEEAAHLEVPRVPGASDQRYEEAAHLEVPRVPGASDQRYEAVGHLEVPRAPGASDQRYAEVAHLEGPRVPGAADQRHAAVEHLSVPRAPGASDQRYAQGGRRYLEVPRVPGASDQNLKKPLLPGGVTEYRYLEVPRAPGASEQRYADVAAGQGRLDVSRAPGALEQRSVPTSSSDRQYLSVPRAEGASDQRYLSVPRAPGASDQRYLSVERAPGASDQRYLTVERAQGASDQRYLTVERIAGASDQRYLTVPRATGASEQSPGSTGREPSSARSPAVPRDPGVADQQPIVTGRASDQAGAPMPGATARMDQSAPSPDRPAPIVDQRPITPPRPSEQDAPKKPWELSVERGPTASEQRALDKARAEAARPPSAPTPTPPAPDTQGPKSSSRSRPSRRGRK
jgi:hypothetical protein